MTETTFKEVESYTLYNAPTQLILSELYKRKAIVKDFKVVRERKTPKHMIKYSIYVVAIYIIVAALLEYFFGIINTSYVIGFFVGVMYCLLYDILND